MEQGKIGIIGVGHLGSDHSKRIVNGDVPELKLAVSYTHLTLPTIRLV